MRLLREADLGNVNASFWPKVLADMRVAHDIHLSA